MMTIVVIHSQNNGDDLAYMQGALDTLIEKANIIDFPFSATKTTCVHFCQKRGRHPVESMPKAGETEFAPPNCKWQVAGDRSRLE